MRSLLIIIIFGMVACVEKATNDNASDTTKALQESTKANQADTTINTEKTGNDNPLINLRSVSFFNKTLVLNGECGEYIVKMNRERIPSPPPVDAKGYHTTITLDYYLKKDSKNDSMLVKTITIHADSALVYSNYIHSKTYGCCGFEDYSELSTIWTNEPFLKFTEKYFVVKVPNSSTKFYFGYLNYGNLTQSDDENKNLILGELYLIQSFQTHDQEKENCYSEDFKIANKVTFRAKTKSIYDSILPFNPDIRLVKNTNSDQLISNPNYDELQLSGFSNTKSLDSLNLLGLKMEFERNTKNTSVIVPIDIPLRNGFLFGDTTYERTIFIDK